jgi:flap endonuclease-1
MRGIFYVSNQTVIMGIRGLHICIKKTIPEVIVPVNWSSWSNHRIGIDIQCFLYRAISRGESPLEAIADQIAHFRKNNIKVIYVFDGKPPAEKDGVNDKRSEERRTAIETIVDLRNRLDATVDKAQREIIMMAIRDLESKYPTLSYEIKDEVKKFLYATGTMFICASCEADTLLAYWYRRKIIDAVASYDYDFIARGCVLLMPTAHDWNQWEMFDSVKIRERLHLSESRFSDLCVLMGSDYSPGLPIVPWKAALHALQHGESIDVIWARHTFSNWRQLDMKKKLQAEMDVLIKAKRILAGDDDIPSSMMEDIQWSKWNAGYVNPEPSALLEFQKIYTNWSIDWWQQFTLAV